MMLSDVEVTVLSDDSKLIGLMKRRYENSIGFCIHVCACDCFIAYGSVLC